METKRKALEQSTQPPEDSVYHQPEPSLVEMLDRIYPKPEEKPTEYRACVDCGKAFPCAFSFQGKPICLECRKPDTKQECDHVKRYDQVFAGTSSTTGKKVCYCESAFPERACEHCFLDPEESAERQDIQLCCNCGIKRKRPDDTESYTKAEIDERFDAIAEMCEKMMGWWQTDDERHSNAHSLCRKGQKIEEKQWRKALLDVITQIPLPRYLSSLEMAQNQKRIESLRSKYT